MNYKHLSQIERYQIHSLMKAQHNISQIARLIGRNKSTISRELRRNAGCRCYRAKQACELVCKRSESSRNTNTLVPWAKEQASDLCGCNGARIDEALGSTWYSARPFLC